MSPQRFLCRTDRERRALTRRTPLNGIDYLEVSSDQTQLTVYFLGKAPAREITPAQLRIDGGRRIRGIKVTRFDLERSDRDDVDDVMTVTVDRPGDASTYTLCVVDLDIRGNPVNRPPRDFDPRYARACFSFKAACPSDLDCVTAPACEARPVPPTGIDYLAKDYASFRRLILDRLALVMPDWRERHVPDLGITLVELLAYVGDQLSYYQDAVATEAYLGTARRRISVRRHVRLVDYRLHEGCNARTWVTVSISQPELRLALADFYFVAGGAEGGARVVAHDDLPPNGRHLIFEPVRVDGKSEVELRQAHNTIRFYTWGETECCLPKGATSATLVDPGAVPPPTEKPPTSYVAGQHAANPPVAPQTEPPDGAHYRLQLSPCDVLLFEEMVGPRSGAATDADRTHRHAVRLTRVARTHDPLTGQLLIEIEWCEEDALPFPLCLSSISVPPECELLSDVSVARGNVILVDHGETVSDDLGPVPDGKTTARCDDACTPAEIRKLAVCFGPALPRPEVTHAQPVAPCRTSLPPCDDWCATSSASAALLQDAHVAFPQVWLTSYPADANRPPGTLAIDGANAVGRQLARVWQPRLDLLGSGPDDPRVVVEIDDDRVAHLRFGDGDCGRRPEAGEMFRARYRIGNGSLGNVSADTVTGMVFRNNLPSGVRLAARNPIPARGGTPPELVEDAKLRAPYLIRHRLERAITPADYAAIVKRDFSSTVQAAAAVFRWNGMGTEVLVAVDAVARSGADDTLLCRIERHLRRYRRIGHELRVVWAQQVPLMLGLRVCVKAGYLRGHVKSALLAAFSSRALPGGKPGWFHPDRLTFGEGVLLSRIVAAAQAIDGVESVEVTRLERLFEGPNGELDAGILTLGAMEIARLDNDPDFPEQGQLSLIVDGGR